MRSVFCARLQQVAVIQAPRERAGLEMARAVRWQQLDQRAETKRSAGCFDGPDSQASGYLTDPFFQCHGCLVR